MASLIKAFLAIDVGGTYLKSAVLNQEGEVIRDSTLRISSVSNGSRKEILQAFGYIIRKSMDFIEERGYVSWGIGMAFPGPFDIYRSTSLMKHKFQALYGMNLHDYFHSIPFVPERISLKFIHDAHAVLTGEIWKGNAQGFDHVALVTLGTGLGFAVAEKGRILCNDIGGPSISIFKKPFKNGILEDYVSRRGFLNKYKELSGNPYLEGIDVSDLGRLADQGEKNSLLTFHLAGDILANALQEVLLERSIQCLLLGGQISKSFHHMAGSLIRGLDHVASLKKVATVSNIDNAAFTGMVKAFQE